MQQKAARVAAETPSYDSNAHACGWISIGTGVASLALGTVTFGGGFVVGIASSGTAFPDKADAC
jgi:hypothetical protein